MNKMENIITVKSAMHVMDKETFVKRMAELVEIKQKALEHNRKERQKATESYISQNCQFKIGDKVKYKGKPGTIEDIKAEYDGQFVYDVRFDKKDGTPSCRATTVYEWMSEKIEKA